MIGFIDEPGEISEAKLKALQEAEAMRRGQPLPPDASPSVRTLNRHQRRSQKHMEKKARRVIMQKVERQRKKLDKVLDKIDLRFETNLTEGEADNEFHAGS